YTRQPAPGLQPAPHKWPGRTRPLRISRIRCALILRYAAPVRFWPRIGRLRNRLPVAAKMALVTAGWIMVAPGSPTPPHFLPAVGVRYTSVLGASFRRTTG